MRIPRIFADIAASEPGSLIPLAPNDAHHLAQVLRLPQWSKAIILDRSSGAAFEAELHFSKSQVTAKIIRALPASDHGSIVRSLTFALCKGPTNDFVVEKATELGVREINFVHGERSNLRLKSAGDREKKLSRWRKIAEGAAKQCRRSDIPEVHIIEDIPGVLDRFSPLNTQTDSFFLLSPQSGSLPIRDIRSPRGCVHLVVGPEGGLSDVEEELLTRGGFQRVSLGMLILRAETAAVVGIGVFQALFGSPLGEKVLSPHEVSEL